MMMKIENIWNELHKDNLHKYGFVFNNYKNVNSFITLKMPEGIKGIAFAINNSEIDIPQIKDLLDISFEILDEKIFPDKSMLVINLLNNKLKSIFSVLCEDLFNTASQIQNDDQKLIKMINQRLYQWKELFRIAGGQGLSLKKQLGLFGELYFLKKIIKQNIDIDFCFDLWRGPENDVRDYEYNQWALEVKTTHTHNHQILHISSERQLDTNLLDNLYLFHISLEKRSGNEYTLNRIIDEIYHLINHHIDADYKFKTKLAKYGYFDHQKELYNNYSFIIRNETYYLVKDDFPRIEENFLLDGVGDVKYSLILNDSTNKYKTDFENIIKDLENEN
jgi:hypothetical protein